MRGTKKYTGEGRKGKARYREMRKCRIDITPTNERDEETQYEIDDNTQRTVIKLKEGRERKLHRETGRQTG